MKLQYTFQGSEKDLHKNNVTITMHVLTFLLTEANNPESNTTKLYQTHQYHLVFRTKFTIYYTLILSLAWLCLQFSFYNTSSLCNMYVTIICNSKYFLHHQPDNCESAYKFFLVIKLFIQTYVRVYVFKTQIALSWCDANVQHQKWYQKKQFVYNTQHLIAEVKK